MECEKERENGQKMMQGEQQTEAPCQSTTGQVQWCYGQFQQAQLSIPSRKLLLHTYKYNPIPSQSQYWVGKNTATSIVPFDHC